MTKARIAYVSGPVEAQKVFEAYAGEKHPENFGTSYLKQFFGVADGYDFEQLIITTNDFPIDEVVHPGKKFVNIPVPISIGGLRYHLAMFFWSVKTLFRLISFRPGFVVLTAGQNYFFVTSMIKFFGSKVIVSYHCTLQNFRGVESVPDRFYHWLNAMILPRTVSRFMGVSELICRQVVELLGVPAKACSRFSPTYDRKAFDSVLPSTWDGEGIFKLLFCGRVEQNKGVFDLVQIANMAKKNDQLKIQIDVCGEGDALHRLRETTANDDLQETINVHGLVASDLLGEFYNDCHAVIVPTRTDFEEGFNKVCAEAIMARRPVITSRVCPALEDVREAAIEAQPDDASDYFNAVVTLAEEQEFYAQKIANTDKLRELFFDETRSYAATLQQTIKLMQVSGNKSGRAS